MALGTVVEVWLYNSLRPMMLPLQGTYQRGSVAVIKNSNPLTI